MYFYFSITHFGVNYTKEKKIKYMYYMDQTPQLHPKIVHLNDKRK